MGSREEGKEKARKEYSKKGGTERNKEINYEEGLA